MLSVAGEHLAELNPDARLVMFGQELNPESYAICKADMLIKGQDIANIVFGNTLSADGLLGQALRLHALQSALRRGVEEDRDGGHARSTSSKGFAGRFGPGLPRVSRRLAALPAAPDLQDAPRRGRRQPLRHRAQRLAAVHRRPPARARARSAATCWRTTCSRPSSACRPTCSTTPASAPTSGSSPTASPSTARARCSSSTPATSGRRCARASAASARRWPRSTSTW